MYRICRALAAVHLLREASADGPGIGDCDHHGPRASVRKQFARADSDFSAV
jgi:hypothetical protein